MTNDGILAKIEELNAKGISSSKQQKWRESIEAHLVATNLARTCAPELPPYVFAFSYANTAYSKRQRNDNYLEEFLSQGIEEYKELYSTLAETPEFNFGLARLKEELGIFLFYEGEKNENEETILRAIKELTEAEALYEIVICSLNKSINTKALSRKLRVIGNIAFNYNNLVHLKDDNEEKRRYASLAVKIAEDELVARIGSGGKKWL